MIDLSGAAALARRLGLAPLASQPPDTSADDTGLLDDYEERAAIMEFDGGLPRDEAEARAWQEVFGSKPKPRKSTNKQENLTP